MKSSSLLVLEGKEAENGAMLRGTRRDVRSLLSLNRSREFETLCNMLGLEPSDSLLDVGSGDGYWTERFACRVGQATGLEPDDAVLSHARTFHAGTNVRYEQGVAESLPFADGTFDKVVGLSSLEHFSDPHKALQEMFRVLRSGGRLAVSVDALTSENSSSDFRRWQKRRHYVTTYFREEELTSILSTIGFLVEQRTVHIFRSPLSRWARETFVKHPRPLLPLYPLFRSLVALGETSALDAHTQGQIIVLCAMRPTSAGQGRAA